MKFGIDTCTWLKIFHLKAITDQLLEVLLANFQIFITHDVLNECLHFLPNKKAVFEQIEVLPRIGQAFQEYKELGFDDADASLLEYADRNIFGNKLDTQYIIITEDPEMLQLNIAGTNRIIQFVDIIVLLYSSGYIEKRLSQELVQDLFSKRNITKRKKQRALQEIQA
jgi:rRNA-processing protein FCF1